MQVISAESTELFVGPPDAPLQLARVTRQRGHRADAGPRRRRRPERRDARQRRRRKSSRCRSRSSTRSSASDGPRRCTPVAAATPFAFTVAEPGWTMFMISHFHYDPVWWNTQAAYTSLWTEDPPGTGPADQRFRAGARAPGNGPPRTRIQIRAGRGGLPQAVLGHPPRGPRRPAPADRRGPGGDHGRHLQRAQHQPHQPGDDDPKPGARHRVSARRAGCRPGHRVAARRVRPRPAVPGDGRRRRADVEFVGPRAAPPVGADAHDGGDPDACSSAASSSGSRRRGAACSPTTCPRTTRRAGGWTRRRRWPKPRRPPTSCSQS